MSESKTIPWRRGPARGGSERPEHKERLIAIGGTLDRGVNECEYNECNGVVWNARAWSLFDRIAWWCPRSEIPLPE